MARYFPHLLLALLIGAGCAGEGDSIGKNGAGGSPDSVEFGDPVEVGEHELEQWVWVSVPEMRCSDGSEGGFAVNFTEASRNLLIYLQGGGICYDRLSCAVGGAARSVGDDPIRTALDRPVREQEGFFDRDNPANPFRESNFVVVPHCTGDHHTGDKIAEYGTSTFHHVGYRNITRMLERVVPTFADAEQVVLSGFSAGGVGITANYHQLAHAFESIGQPAPYLMIDGGPFMRPPYLKESAQQVLQESWALEETIGVHCPECLTQGFHALYKRNAELHPGARASLITTYEDSVVTLLYSLLNSEIFTGGQMREGLHDLADWLEAEAESMWPGQFEVFYFEGTGHGILHVNGLYSTPGLMDFLMDQLGSEGWGSIRP